MGQVGMDVKEGIQVQIDYLREHNWNEAVVKKLEQLFAEADLDEFKVVFITGCIDEENYDEHVDISINARHGDTGVMFYLDELSGELADGEDISMLNCRTGHGLALTEFYKTHKILSTEGFDYWISTTRMLENEEIEGEYRIPPIDRGGK